MNNEINNLYEFHKFRFNPRTNTLWRDQEVVALPPKALELLKLLLEKQGEVVSKQEIFDTVWADTFVEDGVLTQNIYTLRQTLGTHENGKQLIENLARRGYRLTTPVHLVSSENGSGKKSEVTESFKGAAVTGSFSKFLFVPPIIFLLAVIVFLFHAKK